MPYVMFVAVAALWVAFGAALLGAAGSLAVLWDWVRAQPVLLQGAMWLLLLPWMSALAIWESSWQLWLRLGGVAGLAWVTLSMFLPKTG